ncbi:hypothetical protein [Mesorhizobium sp. M0767]|uniref:hypothetical protein n=1 Tax=Mesorhizobium sp. M0767 TaxID=2956995 RepID=UPI00333DD75E
MTAENPAPNPSTGARTNPDADDFWTQAKSTLDQFDANVGHRVTELLQANNRYQQEARDARAALEAARQVHEVELSGASHRGQAMLDAKNEWKARTLAAETALKGGFQDRVQPFMVACLGEEIARDGIERNHRFLEESLELVQALGCTASEAHQLVDYVFGRAIGEPHQEAGGVAVTFAALCNAHGINGAVAAENELTRCWSKIDKIRAKQAAKPKHGPLPEHTAIAKPVAEWHEDDGYAVWWTWHDGDWLGEPSYIGSPLCDDWPGYHTHWTPHPAFPSPPVPGTEAANA